MVIKKSNFYKMRKAKRAVKKLIGAKKWRKLHRILQLIFIQLMLCKRTIQKFKNQFKRLLKLARHGASGNRLARALKKTKWASKNPKAAKKMAKCLKQIRSTYKMLSIFQQRYLQWNFN